MSGSIAPARITARGASPAGRTGGTGVGTGLQLLRSILESSSRTQFRALSEDLFIADELPYFNFTRQHYQRHGVLPTLDAMAEQNLRLVHAAPEPVAYYYGRVLTRAQFNVAMQHHPAYAAALQSRDMVVALEVLDQIKDSMRRYVTVNDTYTLSETIEGVIEYFERASLNPGMQGITLGWPYLDEKTGGAEGGDVVTMAARPGMGKSWLLIKMAREAWMAGASVLFVTNEMTHRQIGRRLLGLEAGINSDFIRRGQMSAWAREMLYQTVRNMSNGAPFHLISGAFNKSVPAVDAAIQEFSPDVTYIDASYLMKPNRSPRASRSNDNSRRRPTTAPPACAPYDVGSAARKTPSATSACSCSADRLPLQPIPPHPTHSGDPRKVGHVPAPLGGAQPSVDHGQGVGRRVARRLGAPRPQQQGSGGSAAPAHAQ